ncbi:MAG TPA: hypothetical protein VF630_18770 [Hymenobacter sp.]
MVPFYDGAQPNVIPVYENSFFFEGYLAQGYRQYFKEEYEHYLFVADDMVLNPAITEDTYARFFQLDEGDSFIPEIFSLHNLSNNDTLWFRPILSKERKVKNFWWRIQQAVEYSPQKEAVESEHEMPAFAEAENKLKQHGYEIRTLHHTDLHGGLHPSTDRYTLLKQQIKYALNYKGADARHALKYPLVASYSDIVIVHKDAIQKFVHYCGVFAATELFVEFAIPTALLLATDAGKVKTEPAIGQRGVLYWNYEAENVEKYEQALQQYGFELRRLLANFPADKLYIHPIKLSKWKTELPEASH